MQQTVFNGNYHKFDYNLFCEHIFIKKKKVYIFFFSIEGANNFFGGAMHAYAPP